MLFAIRNGGFSGAIMPVNIVVGEEAEAVADFLSEYSGGGGGGDPALLDLRLIRADPQPARDAPARRGVDPAILDQALELDERRRALLPELEELRRRKNEASEQIGELKRTGADASEAIAEVRSASGCEKELTEELRSVEEGRAVLAALPNLPDPDAPPADEALREVGEPGREGRDHVELLGGLVDLEAGARVAGSRFAYLKGPVIVRLQFAPSSSGRSTFWTRRLHAGCAARAHT